MLSIEDLGKKLVEAGRLRLRPLCVYGTNGMPQGAIPSYTIDRWYVFSSSESSSVSPFHDYLVMLNYGNQIGQLRLMISILTQHRLIFCQLRFD
jgi:hypothetical protein